MDGVEEAIGTFGIYRLVRSRATPFSVHSGTDLGGKHLAPRAPSSHHLREGSGWLVLETVAPSVSAGAPLLDLETTQDMHAPTTRKACIHDTETTIRNLTLVS